MALLRRSQSHVESTAEPKSFLSLQEEMRMNMAASKQLVRQCKSAMLHFKKHDLLTDEEWDGLYKLVNVFGLPCRHKLLSLHPKLDHHLIQDFCDLKIFHEYIKNSIQQHSDFEEKLLKTEFDDVEHNLLCLLERLQSTLKCKGTTVDHSRASTGMPEWLKRLGNTKVRYCRDFIIMKDIKIFVKTLAYNYRMLFLHLV